MTKTKTTRPSPVRFDVGRFRDDFEEVMAEWRKLLPQVAEETRISEPTVYRFLSGRHGARVGISLDTAVRLAHWAMLDLCAYIVYPAHDE